MAFARWLILFLISIPSSANVFPYSGIMNNGSYPNPLSPAGRVAIWPGHSAWTTSDWLFGAASTKQQVKWAERSSPTSPPSSDKSLALFAASLFGSPAKRAEYTPGWPSSASTQRPESSANTIVWSSFAIVSAFKRAFSSKVVPVSSTSSNSGKSRSVFTEYPFGSKISANSLAFPTLFVAITISFFNSTGFTSSLSVTFFTFRPVRFNQFSAISSKRLASPVV